MENGVKAFDHQDWISQRKVPHTIDVVDPDPSWPSLFESLAATIRGALDPSTILAIHHTGSTSVPGLASKPVIDIDLILADPADETTYAPQLQAAGFHFLFRQPPWYQHRMFALYDPFVNLHVYGPGDLELESKRHRVLRDWLRKCPEDRDLYGNTKREASKRAKENGEGIGPYTAYKESVILEIMERAKADAAKQV